MSKIYSKDKDPKKKESIVDKILKGETTLDEDRNQLNVPTNYDGGLGKVIGIGGLATYLSTVAGGTRYNKKAVGNLNTLLDEKFKEGNMGDKTLEQFKTEEFKKYGISTNKSGSPKWGGWKKGLAESGKNFFSIGKSNIPVSLNTSTVVPNTNSQWSIADNIAKTIADVYPSKTVDKIKKYINPSKTEVPKTIVDKPVKINTTNSGYTEGPFPIDSKPTVAPEVNKKVFAKTKGRISNFQRMMQADVFPSPTNVSGNGTNLFSIEPNMQKLWNLKLGLGAGAGAGGALLLNETLMNTKENPDRGLVQNAGDAVSSLVDPRGYAGLLTFPKIMMDNANLNDKPLARPYLAATALDYVGKKANEGLSYVIDKATKPSEQIESENETMKLYETNPTAAQQGVIRKAYSKPGSITIDKKETPDYNGLDLQKAVIYGDTKKSGSDALDKISNSTGIPRDVLISNAKKMWKKNKK